MQHILFHFFHTLFHLGWISHFMRYFTFSIPYFTLCGTTDRTAVRETQRHSYLYQSRHRDSSMVSLWTDFWLFNSARHPTANVTHRHSYLHQTQPRHIVIPLQASAQWLAANLELTFSHFMKMYFKAISLLFDLNRSKLNWYWNKMNSTWNITSVVALHGAGMKLWKDNKSDYAS